MRALSILLLGLACAHAEGNPPPAANGPEGPVIVELFTSQGCSSCPSADRVLSKMTKSRDVGGRAVAPLSFHVDYWNDLGWADPYSAPAWTDRQRQYARALGDNRVYTPEIVVGGIKGMVGSHASAVVQSITDAPRPALLPATARWTADHVEITATAPADADVLVAVWEAERAVKVTRGENTGETLTNNRIVRRLERVATAGKQGVVKLPIDRAWRSVGAVAFAQRADKRIVASVALAR